MSKVNGRRYDVLSDFYAAIGFERLCDRELLEKERDL